MESKHVQYTGFILALVFSLMGCQSKPTTAYAPLNSQDVLQKLANAYKKQAEPLALNPLALTPSQRKKFVKSVFVEAGYDYTGTLLQLALVNPDSISPLHKDMRDLLFLPHYGVKLEEVKSIYTQQELAAIGKINQHFR